VRRSSLRSPARRGTSLVRRRPFRSPPHHLVCGNGRGGPHISPGEVTLANDGILFLDELPEFDRGRWKRSANRLRTARLRLPGGRAAVFPSRFQLVAAMNPCRAATPVRATAVPLPAAIVDRYAGRVSARCATVSTVGATCLVCGPRIRDSASPEGSKPVAERVALARRRQVDRQECLNARLSGRALRAACDLGGPAQAQAIRLADLEGWSARGTNGCSEWLERSRTWPARSG